MAIVPQKNKTRTMAAKDYRICCGFFNAYIAKVSKHDPYIMLDDRREITDDEILTLIDWFLDNRLKEGDDTITFDSDCRENCKVEISFIKKQ